MLSYKNLTTEEQYEHARRFIKQYPDVSSHQEDAEDIIQDTMFYLWRRGGRVDAGLVYLNLKQRVHNFRKKRARTIQTNERWGMHVGDGDLLLDDIIPSYEWEPDRIAALNEALAAVDERWPGRVEDLLGEPTQPIWNFITRTREQRQEIEAAYVL